MANEHQFTAQTRIKQLSWDENGMIVRWWNTANNNKEERSWLGLSSSGTWFTEFGNTDEYKALLEVLRDTRANWRGEDGSPLLKAELFERLDLEPRYLMTGVVPQGWRTDNFVGLDHPFDALELHGRYDPTLRGSGARYAKKQRNEGAHMRFGDHQIDGDGHIRQILRHSFRAEPHIFPAGQAVHLPLIPEWRIVPLADRAFEFVTEFDLSEGVTTAAYSDTAKGRALGVFLNSIQQNTPAQGDVDLTALHLAASYPGNHQVREGDTDNHFLFTITAVHVQHHQAPHATIVRRVALRGLWAVGSVAIATAAAKYLQVTMASLARNADNSGSVAVPREFGGADVPVQAAALDLGGVHISGRHGVPRLTGVDAIDGRPWSTPFVAGRVIQWLTLPTATTGYRRVVTPQERAHVTGIRFDGDTSTAYLQLLNPQEYCDGWGIEIPLEVQNSSRGASIQDLRIMHWNGTSELFRLRPKEEMRLMFVSGPDGGGEVRGDLLPLRVMEQAAGEQGALFSTASYWQQTIDGVTYRAFCLPGGFPSNTGNRVDADAFSEGSTILSTDGETLSGSTARAVKGAFTVRQHGRLNLYQRVQIQTTDGASGTAPWPRTYVYRLRGSVLEQFDRQFHNTIVAGDEPTFQWRCDIEVEPDDVILPLILLDTGGALGAGALKAAGFRRVVKLAPAIHVAV